MFLGSSEAPCSGDNETAGIPKWEFRETPCFPFPINYSAGCIILSSGRRVLAAFMAANVLCYLHHMLVDFVLLAARDIVGYRSRLEVQVVVSLVLPFHRTSNRTYCVSPESNQHWKTWRH